MKSKSELEEAETVYMSGGTFRGMNGDSLGSHIDKLRSVNRGSDNQEGLQYIPSNEGTKSVKKSRPKPNKIKLSDNGRY